LPIANKKVSTIFKKKKSKKSKGLEYSMSRNNPAKKKKNQLLLGSIAK
jgi:hypothetical protein